VFVNHCIPSQRHWCSIAFERAGTVVWSCRRLQRTHEPHPELQITLDTRVIAPVGVSLANEAPDELQGKRRVPLKSHALSAFGGSFGRMKPHDLRKTEEQASFVMF
jgi:hypothetical protein